MNKENRWRLLVSFICAGLLLLLAACGGNESQTDSNSTDLAQAPAEQPNVPAADNKPEESGKPIDIIVYSNSGGTKENFAIEYGDALKKALPQYNVQYIPKESGSTFRNLLASGQQIDILYDSIGFFADTVIDSGMSYDMTELIKKAGVDIERFDTTLIDAMRALADGGIYGLPIKNTIMLLYYNPEIFDHFGVDYPKDGMTWDEAIDLGRQLTRTDGDKQYIGLSLSFGHYMRMNPYSVPYLDPETLEPTINVNEHWKKMYQLLLDMTGDAGYQSYLSSNNNKLPSTPQFVNDQNLAMMGWLSGAIFPEIKWDIVSMPTFRDQPDIGTQSYPTYWSIASISENKEQAMEVIKYLVSDEFQMLLSENGTMPVVKDKAIQEALGSKTEVSDRNYAAFFHNQLAPISVKHIHDQAIETEYRREIGDLIGREKDLNSVLRTAEERAKNKLAELMQ